MNDTDWWAVASEHGMTDALIAAARSARVELADADLSVPDPDPSDVTLTSARGAVNVRLHPVDRVFAVRIAAPSHTVAIGRTDDLAQVIAVHEAWRSGASLDDLHASFPFLESGAAARAFESGNEVEFRWDSYFSDPEYAEIHPLLRAAHSHPRLARLYPSVSMFTTVRFALSTTDTDAGEIRIRVERDTYKISSSLTSERYEVATIAEAVAVAATLLPDSGIA
ncbi:MAG: DUF6193 family natural product biosynthesis protein [Jiangellaceae bacterium]